jgi:O-antigen/teichoic acid export membrane protein
MFGTQVFGAAVGVINGIILARMLGPAGKGEYYLLILLPGTAMVLLHLGLPAAFRFFAARGQTHGIVTKSLVLTTLLTGGACLVGLAVLPIVQTAFLRGIPGEVVLIALLALPLSLHATFSAAVVVGRQAVRMYAAVNSLYPLVWTVLLIVVFVLLGLSVAAAIAVYLIVKLFQTLCFALAAVRVSRAVERPTPAPYRDLLRYGLRAYPESLAAFFNYRIDAYLIALLIANPAESLGYYSMAVGLAEIVLFVPKAVSDIFFPQVAGSNRVDANRHVALVARVTLLLASVGAVVFIPAATIMIWFVLPAFVPSLTPLLVLLPGIVALGAGTVAGGYLTGIGKPGITSMVTLVSVAVNVAANLLLIPRIGIVGAAAASLVSYSVSSVLLTVVAAHHSGLPVRQFWLPRASDIRFVAATVISLVNRVSTRGRDRRADVANVP